MAAKKKKLKPRAKTKTAQKPRVKAKAKPAKAKAKLKVVAKAKTKTKTKAAPKKVAKAKAAPKKAAKAKAAPKKAKATLAPRRDATGHLDPTYARELRARSRGSREPDERAFLSRSRSGDDLAEELGEEAVAAMTSGEDQGERMHDAETDEERGGPFVKTRGREEYARGTDKSNPRSATREPFPTT